MIADFSYFFPPVGAWIAVTDDDAADFLQSQFSNDLRGDPGTAIYGLWLDHRGRIGGDSTILRVADQHFLLHSWATPGEALAAKLSAHVVADEVVLEDLSATARSALIYGTGAADWLEGLGVTLPLPGHHTHHEGLFWMAPAPGLPNAWQAVGPGEAIAHLRSKLAEMGKPADAEEWHATRIRGRHPLIPTEVGPEETPIEAGLEEYCSWNKGCFLGQEVVARQHRLGRCSRSLESVRIDRTVPREELPLGLLDQDDTRVGQLRATAASARDRTVGLALIKTRFLERERSAVLRIDGHGGSVRIDGVGE